MTIRILSILALLACASRLEAQGTCPLTGASSGGATGAARRATPSSDEPRFRVFWRDVERVAKAATTGPSESEAGDGDVSGPARPLLVHVYDGDDVDARYAIESDEALADERVALGSRLFDCVRIHADKARRDPALAPHAKRTPCLLVLHPDLEVAGALRGRLHAGRLARAMDKALDRDFENSLRTLVREFGKIAEERADLAHDEARLAHLDGEERAEAQAALAAREADLDRREKALFELKPRR